ncbi:MAG TPA: ABC transporter permease [Steroidobacteraceae bacterium]|nr:ABC transporter permease [Steroidobacteraceae bacterium]
MARMTNISALGVKELWSLWRDPMMLVLVVYAFTFSIYIAGTAAPDILHRVPVAIVDEDHSPLSARIESAFQPPYFGAVQGLSLSELDPGMDAGKFTLGLVVPPNFQRDVLRGRNPELQINVDATRQSQAFSGAAAAQQIVAAEVTEFVQRYRGTTPPPVDIATRMRFNPTLEMSWFAAVMEVINDVTMLSIILTGAALLREREHGTVEHLLVMPVTPAEIMTAKVWSMGLVVIVAAALSMSVVVQGALQVRIQGSLLLFLATAVLHLFATTSMGIFLATVARSMPQFGLLVILTLMPLQMLSGSLTPRESMPQVVQTLMLAAPTTHFVAAAQAVLYRGAGLDVIWPRLVAIGAIGAAFFGLALARFRRTLSLMA